ncbi:PhzF family phenazine biosynthesis protein [Psychroserpens sp. SPM9]|uniref:PhzF family phenazine biosynthesis protein n=1 Tax=Psychroserpens sp. SPM9 TaxID=2975598 RepID=UPI0021A38EE8|nr:PhzF family phenazine biosynthesis protein [Psychroserpens sp. SPM9]MDG5492896.1 PhzF family phenazine biosynthesis protein [Psychroserpens sp. SPM9]
MEVKNKIQVQILNAFVDNDKGGNPAGVVLNADNLTDKQMLEIAGKVGLSETAFVSKSNQADFKLDFFTPNRRIAHCGHATVATFSYLKQLGLVKNDNTSKETVDGNRDIKLIGDLAFMEQLEPKYVDVSHRKNEILKSLNIEEKDLLPNAEIQLVNTGNSFILIPVKSTEILENIIPNNEMIIELSDEFDLIGFYPFTTNIQNKNRDASTRMFGPRYEIWEEAGTGMAAGPLACYLHDKMNIKKERFLIQQGEFMKEPSPSLIIVDLKIKNNKILGLMAGGKGTVQKQFNIEIS